MKDSALPHLSDIYPLDWGTSFCPKCSCEFGHHNTPISTHGAVHMRIDTYLPPNTYCDLVDHETEGHKTTSYATANLRDNFPQPVEVSDWKYHLLAQPNVCMEIARECLGVITTCQERRIV